MALSAPNQTTPTPTDWLGPDPQPRTPPALGRANAAADAIGQGADRIPHLPPAAPLSSAERLSEASKWLEPPRRGRTPRTPVDEHDPPSKRTRATRLANRKEARERRAANAARAAAAAPTPQHDAHRPVKPRASSTGRNPCNTSREHTPGYH
jgi:hypothetical protein